MTATHWSYGSGTVGCLYDGGPGFAETKEEAIDAALSPFFDLPPAVLRRAREALRRTGRYQFHAACADYVEITPQDGPCPEDDAG